MRINVSIVLLLVCGCSQNPWTYNSPPGHGIAGADALHKPVVILDQFAVGNGVNQRWAGIAPHMQQAFSRALIKSGKFDVIMDDSLSVDSLRAITEYGDDRARSLAKIRKTVGSEAVFFVQVHITDFLHTSEAPKSVQKRNWLTKSNDALVAFDLTVLDLQVGKTALSDQLVATVSAGDDEIDQYGSLEFGSYLFWSTPLGRASSEVINEATTLMAGLQVASPGGSAITSRKEGGREVSLSLGSHLDDGAIYFVGTVDVVTGRYIQVDDDLGRPLRLRVEKGFFGGSTGWLLSEPAAYEGIIGATLSRTPLVAVSLIPEQ